MSLPQRLRSPWVVMPVVAAVALGLWYAFVRDDGPTSSATTSRTQVVQATSGTMADTISADGTVAAADTEDLSFASAGTVTKVAVEAGDTVKAGQVLAEIDSAELASSLASAQATLAEAEAKLADDEDAGASDAQLEADASSVQSAQDQVDQAQEDLDGAKLTASIDGTVAEVNVTVGEQLSSGGSGGTDRTGSQSGSGGSAASLGSGGSVPGASNGSTGSDGSGSTTADISIVTTGRYTVELGIDASDIAKVEVGQEATVSLSTSSSSTAGFSGGGFPGGGFPGGGAFVFPGQGQQGQQGQAGGSGSGSTTTTTAPAASTDGAAGLVTEVGKVADASSGVSTYPVTVSFRDTSGTYNVGASVTVAITHRKVTGAVQVPSLAVTTTDGQSTVQVKTSTGTEARVVETGMTSGGMVRITSGLEAGESVVLTLPGAPGGTQGNGSGGGPSGEGPSGGGSFSPPEGFGPAAGSQGGGS